MSDKALQTLEDKALAVMDGIDGILDDLDAALREQAAGVAGDGSYSAPFVSVLSAQSQAVKDGAALSGQLLIAISKDKHLYADAISFLHIGYVGMFGKGSRENPPLRQWTRSKEDTPTMREKYGWKICQSRGLNGAPDKEFIGNPVEDYRIEDPAQGLVRGEKWGEDEMFNFVPAFEIPTRCDQCQAGKWFRSTEDEQDRSGPPCREYVQAVIWPIAATTTDPDGAVIELELPRKLMVVEFRGSAAMVFNRSKKGHRAFQDEKGVTPYMSVIEDGLPKTNMGEHQQWVIPYFLTSVSYVNADKGETFIPIVVSGIKAVKKNDEAGTIITLRDRILAAHKAKPREEKGFAAAVQRLIGRSLIQLWRKPENESQLDVTVVNAERVRAYRAAMQTFTEKDENGRDKGMVRLRTPFEDAGPDGENLVEESDATPPPAVKPPVAQETDEDVAAILAMMGTPHTPAPVDAAVDTEDLPVIPIPAQYESDDDDEFAGDE